jgi:hypothetical protein
LARALADLGDACRALGQHTEAAALLDEAERIQIRHQFEGDYTDFVLTYRAKLEPNPESAAKLIKKARTIQTRLSNVMGETRTLLLEARLANDETIITKCTNRLLELRGMRPALSQCRLLGKIIDHWEDWICGAPDPEGGTDPFWWL